MSFCLDDRAELLYGPDAPSFSENGRPQARVGEVPATAVFGVLSSGDLFDQDKTRMLAGVPFEPGTPDKSIAVPDRLVDPPQL